MGSGRQRGLFVACLLGLLFIQSTALAKPLRVLSIITGEGHDVASVSSSLLWILKRHDSIQVAFSKQIEPRYPQDADVIILFAPGAALSEEQRAALLQFVRRGGGLIYLHSFPTPSPAEGTVGNVVVEIAQPRHPIMRGVAPFQITDAPVQGGGPIPTGIEILARERDGQPLAWAQQNGKGRVFVTALGHSPSAWRQPRFQQMVLNAVYWCARRNPPQPHPPRPPKGFITLFNGVNLEGWGEVGPPCWSVQDGVIVCSDVAESSGWLRTNRMYRNFILRLEYRISPRGNSGIFLRAPHYGRSSRLGMELQIQDDGNNPPTNTCTSAVYSVVAPRLNPTKPAGEWNQVEITLRDRHLRVVWNGHLVHDINLDDPALNANLPRTHLLYRRPNWGYIGLQNHRSLVEFRNIFLKELQ